MRLHSHLSVIYVPSSVIRHPSSVISRPLQSLPFTPISLFRAVDTDFCVPTVLNRYSPGKWLTEALCVGNSLSTAHYHDLWSASAIRRPLKSLPDRFWLTMGRLMTEADDGWFDGQVWMGHYARGCEYGWRETLVRCCSNSGPSSSMAASAWHLVAAYPVYVYSQWR